MRRSYRHSTACRCGHCARAGRPVTTTIVTDRPARFTHGDRATLVFIVALLGSCTVLGAARFMGIGL